MASEELRKKWGTIFMGEREATVAQLDAMQEPLRREQLKREQQEDYMERVRAKAAERARAILGAAYAERQKVLEEARAEAEAERQQLIREGEALKAAGAVAHGQAAAELAKARAVREEAERIREAAHGEGFQAGMEQAGAELKEFRAELGQSWLWCCAPLTPRERPSAIPGAGNWWSWCGRLSARALAGCCTRNTTPFCALWCWRP